MPPILSPIALSPKAGDFAGRAPERLPRAAGPRQDECMASNEHETTMSLRSGSGVSGFIIGLIVAVAVAIPFASAIGFATNPMTRYLFSGRLSETTPAGYTAFWWLIAIILGALPFLAGWLVTRASKKTASIIGGIVVVLVVGALVLGSLFVF
jgi:amino acid transporter